MTNNTERKAFYSLQEVVNFLLGEGHLAGYWFGEKPTYETGNFWWRKHLRAALSQREQVGEFPQSAHNLVEKWQTNVISSNELCLKLASLISSAPAPSLCTAEEAAELACGIVGISSDVDSLPRTYQELAAIINADRARNKP